MKKVFAVLLLFFLMVGSQAFAADVTRVLDAFDENDPFDADIQVNWMYHFTNASIYREQIANGVFSNKKIASAKGRLDQLDILARIGLYHDFELDLKFPIVIGSTMKLSTASAGSTITAETKNNSNNTLFSLPNNSPSRSGFGDMVVALKYAPLSQARDPLHPSWMVGLEYTIPTGKIMRTNNAAVGLGLHQLKLETAISRRIAFFEPYFGFWGTFRFPSTHSLFKNYGDTQNYGTPGARIGLMLGAEFYPWSVPGPKDHEGKYFALDLGFRTTYTFRGRDYTMLFDAMGSSPQNNATKYERQNPKYNPDGSPNPLYINQQGVTDVSAYGTYVAYVGFDVQPIEYFRIGFRFTFTHTSDHFLTYADLGKDLNNSGHIEYGKKNDPNNPNEYSPVYNSALDEPGHRFKVKDYNDYGIMLFLTGKF